MSKEIKTIDDKCECGAKLLLRHNKTTGNSFLGCSKYPTCKNTYQVDVIPVSKNDIVPDIAGSQIFELNKCLHCNGYASYEMICDEDTDLYIHFVECTQCGSRSKDIETSSEMLDKFTKNELVEAWNKKA